jgi:hypothetical protein
LQGVNNVRNTLESPPAVQCQVQFLSHSAELDEMGYHECVVSGITRAISKIDAPQAVESFDQGAELS